MFTVIWQLTIESEILLQVVKISWFQIKTRVFFFRHNQRILEEVFILLFNLGLLYLYHFALQKHN